MTVEECNGRLEGKGGGDLKHEGVGGAFVIINGLSDKGHDSEEMKEEEVDPPSFGEEKKGEEDNGGGEIEKVAVVKEMEEEEEEKNGSLRGNGEDEDLVSKEKDEAMESSSGVALEKEEALERSADEVEDELERDQGGKTSVFVAQVLSEESDAKGEGVGSEVEPEKAVVDKELEPLVEEVNGGIKGELGVAVGETDNRSESDVNVAETDSLPESEVDVAVTDSRPESVVVDADTDSRPELEVAVTDTDSRRESEVNVADTDRRLESEIVVVENDTRRDSEVIVTETDSRPESEVTVAENDGRQESEVAVAEPNKQAEKELPVEVEDIEESETKVGEQVGNLYQKQEHTTRSLVSEERVIEETDNAGDKELELEPERIDNSEVQGLEPEPELSVVDNDDQKESRSGVEVEVKESETEVRAADHLEESELDQTNESLVSESGEPVIQENVEVEWKQQPEALITEGEKVGVSEVDTSKVEEQKEAEPLVEEICKLSEFRSAADSEPSQDAVMESNISESLPVENEVDEMRSSETDPPTYEPSNIAESLPLENEVDEMPSSTADAPTYESSNSQETNMNGESDSIDYDAPTAEKDQKLEVVDSLEIAESNESTNEIETVTVTEKEPEEIKTKIEIENEPKEDTTNAATQAAKDQKLEVVDSLEIVESNGSTNEIETVTITEQEPEEIKPEIETEKEPEEDSTEAATQAAKDQNLEVVDSLEVDESNGSTNEIETVTLTEKEPEEDSTDAATQAALETAVIKRHHIFMIKVPRFTKDEQLEKKIQQAVSQLEEKTRFRDSVQEEIRKSTVIIDQENKEIAAASAEENAARLKYNAKRKELEGVQVLLNRINCAVSIADIDEKIRKMVHRQQHETIALRQEKQYIHEINQLKRLREQLSLKSSSQEQTDNALSQRSEIERQFENLKKELVPINDTWKSAKDRKQATWKRCNDEKDLLRNLRALYQVANGVRQEAYVRLLELRKQSADKFKHFGMYKADQNAAATYRFCGDNEGLRSHCERQVERIMELWNNDDDFRKEYMKSNVNSTLRRLGTLDGRSLGPDEEAPTIISHLDKRPNNLSVLASRIDIPSASEIKQEYPETQELASTNHRSRLKSSEKLIPQEVMSTICDHQEPQKEDEKESKVEELAELSRKEEQLRKDMASAKEKEAAAELKETLRLEQKAKAKVAEERKKKKEDKNKTRAEHRAQKEADLKEQKKVKKEMKRASVTNANGDGDAKTVSMTDIPSTSQGAETTSSTTKRRTTRVDVAAKQDRVQPLALPLRNRGRRKMTEWLWVALIIILVLLLFLAGYYLLF